MMSGNNPRTIKYGAGAFLCFWAAFSAWVIGGVGEDYRKSLREGLAAKSAPAPTSEPADRRGSSQAKAKPTVVPDLPAVPAPTIPLDSKPSPPVVADRTTIPKPVEAAVPIVKPPAPAEPPLDPFWEEPEQKRRWDFDRLTVEDERELGQALNRMVLKFNSPVKVGPLPRRLQDAAEPYLKTCERKDVKYKFTVIDCDVPNIFSHPGGYIYVCRGLFDWIAEDEDYALEFAIAHEIAHVDLAHAVQCLRDPDVKKVSVGTVMLFFGVVLPGGYKPAMELEADRWAWNRMMKLGRSRFQALAFLRKLEDYSKQNGFENEPLKPNEEPKVPWPDNHIRTHPIPRVRFQLLKEMSGPAPKI